MIKTGTYLTTNEAAKIIGVSAIRVRQFAERGRLKFSQFGPVMAFERGDVLNFAKIPRNTGRPKEKRK